MTDIHAKRLRRLANNGYCADILRNAAERIEMLEKALDMLLVESEDIFVCMADATGIDRHQYPETFMIARKALTGGKEK